MAPVSLSFVSVGAMTVGLPARCNIGFSAPLHNLLRKLSNLMQSNERESVIAKDTRNGHLGRFFDGSGRRI
jgi:hypothetical protein